jgi:REP element-mobilizing transposase RayT
LARGEFGSAVKVGGTDDHLHALVEMRTDTSLAHAMSRWKSLSAGWMHRTIGCRDFACQAGYGAFSVSQSNANAVIGYIEKQAEHHAVKTFQQEFVEFLDRHHVDYDPAHVWD